MTNQESRKAGNEALDLAIRFHNIYERLAPSFGYETRTETRNFDSNTPNGKLMVAVCGEILKDISGKEGSCFPNSINSGGINDAIQ